MHAIERKNVEIISFFLQNGAEVLSEGRNSLCSCCSHSTVECAELLLKYGADVNEKSLVTIIFFFNFFFYFLFSFITNKNRMMLHL